ncbi:hypothetical protein KR200_011223, partial [Drosophila serrata]
MKNSKCLPNERRQLRDQLTRSCVLLLFYPQIKRASSTISAIGAKEPSCNQWNMLMPVREYNKHIAKIPNCKMRQRSVLRPGFVWMCTLPLLILLLLLGVAQALDPAASGASGSSGNIGGGGGGGGGGGAASTAGGNGGASGGSLSSGGPPTLIANLTEQGSPGVYNNRQW